MTPQDLIAVTTKVGPEGHFRVDIPLDPATLNEQLFEVGTWLVEWKIPHQARITMDPPSRRVRISFRDEGHARAFQAQFGGERHDW